MIDEVIVKTECPHCDALNSAVIRNVSYTTKVTVICDTNSGGCGKKYFTFCDISLRLRPIKIEV